MKTDQILFRFTPLSEEDLPFLIRVRNECKDLLHDNREFCIDQALAWMQNLKPQFYVIWIGNIRVGYFRTSNYVGETLSIGADLAKEFRGRGLGYAAYRDFIPFIRRRFNLKKLTLEVLSSNARAIALYTKLGFVEVGRDRQSIRRGAVLIDNITMDLII